MNLTQVTATIHELQQHHHHYHQFIIITSTQRIGNMMYSYSVKLVSALITKCSS